jgi:hypothetical protein
VNSIRTRSCSDGVPFSGSWRVDPQL